MVVGAVVYVLGSSIPGIFLGCRSFKEPNQMKKISEDVKEFIDHSLKKIPEELLFTGK
jgi:hypothetical protein